MKILQASKAYHPHVGGVETVVQQLAEGFAATPGVSSYVLACGEDRKTSRHVHEGVTVTRTASLARVASLPLSPSFAYHMLRHDADILQLHEPALVPSASYLALRSVTRRRFRKLVVWWHSEVIGHDLARPVYGPMHARLLRTADAVIVSAPSLIHNSPTLSPIAHKCRVIHIGIEPDRFVDTAAGNAKVAEIRARYGGKPIVLFAGRLVHYKGVEYLVDAMRRIPDAQLVIAGSGKLRPKIEAMAAECPGNVALLGFVADSDLETLFKACDIFVLPSILPNEAFGIVQLEAMVNGKPVITSDLETGVTYVNQDGKTGLVVKRCDSDALAGALRTLIDDPDLRKRLGDYARERVLRDFTVDGMVRQTLALYRELLGNDRLKVSN